MSEAESQAQVRQILGMKGAQVQNLPKWRLRLQLMKPITWIPLMWGVLCGSASSGGFQWQWVDVLQVLTCMLLSGPLMTGYTQTLNDFYDREIDAINEPYRPIPSGAISIPEVIAQIWFLLLAGLGVAWFLDTWSGQTWPVITTIALIWRTADWQERETYDLYGIEYVGHPHLKRILLPEDWVGWPMRKDYITPDFYELQDAY